MLTQIKRTDIKAVLNLPKNKKIWARDLAQFLSQDVHLNRYTAGESSINALQRLLIFLGYSTTSRGSFKIDGDFGRGTNRGVAQFQFDHDLNPKITLKHLSYPCNWRNAAKNIVKIPIATVDLATLEAMLNQAIENIQNKQVLCGDFDEAIKHLNAIDNRRYLTCQQIVDDYLEPTETALSLFLKEKNLKINPAWVLAIIKQETSGIVRPRFEQHHFSKYVAQKLDKDKVKLRYLSMSQGLGQILGSNYKKVKAASPQAMFSDPLPQQILYVTRFIAKKSDIVVKTEPNSNDFHRLSRYYNGRYYQRHFYHESLARWFNEFSLILK